MITVYVTSTSQYHFFLSVWSAASRYPQSSAVKCYILLCRVSLWILCNNSWGKTSRYVKSQRREICVFTTNVRLTHTHKASLLRVWWVWSQRLITVSQAASQRGNECTSQSVCQPPRLHSLYSITFYMRESHLSHCLFVCSELVLSVSLSIYLSVSVSLLSFSLLGFSWNLFPRLFIF